MVISKKNHTVIWDWNGTLLDDFELSLHVINVLLAERNLPLIDSSRYREVFSFPVKDYYAKIGFDFSREPFEIPAREFIDMYNRDVVKCNLHTGVIAVLERIRSAGKQQVILSAMEQVILEQTLGSHQISHYFDKISGLDNHYADSKIENGKLLIEKLKLNPDETCLIGDTTHDSEVAKELGCSCILVANGHQSEDRLKQTGYPVLDDLRNLNVL